MQAVFWGVRGSYPVPGPDTVRYGGNTSCVEIRTDAGERLIIDAGTGLVRLGEQLATQGQLLGDFHLLLSHLHWDHIQGLPYFAPIYQQGSKVALHGLRSDVDKLPEVLRRVARHEFFPVSMDEWSARLTFHEVHAGRRFGAAAFQVRPFRLNHPFGAVGYRVDADGTSCAYVCDTAPFFQVLHKKHFLRGPEPLDAADRRSLQRLRKGLVDAIRGCDTVIYDTHYTPEEYLRFPHFGHSTPDHALDLCAGQGIRCLVLFHHAPNHTDEQMDQISAHYQEAGARLGMEVITAREGLNLPVRDRSPALALPEVRPEVQGRGQP